MGWKAIKRKWAKQVSKLGRRVKRLLRRQKALRLTLPQPKAPYFALGFVLLGVAWATVDRAAHRANDAFSVRHEPLKLKPLAEVAVDDALSAPASRFFEPAWNEFSKSALRLALVPDPKAQILRLLDDPEERLEPEFKVTPLLKDRVAFWMQIHALYNSRMRVVHDRNHLAMVYGYLDCRPIYRALGPGVNAEVRCSAIEKKVLKELKEKIVAAIAAEGSNLKLLTTDERIQIRDFLSRHGALSPQEAAERLANIRTQTGQSDEFLAALRRSKQLLPHIESVLRKHNLPVALGRIPFVESSFNAKAQSKAGAVGIWQFMPETARQMISSDPKHWPDPLRQTNAAARVLQIFRSLVPDWGMAVTAYNSGVGRIQRIAKKYKLNRVDELLQIQAEDGLGFAGKNFYAQFLSANLVEAYKEQIFEGLIEPADYLLVVKEGEVPFLKESCDL